MLVEKSIWNIGGWFFHSKLLKQKFIWPSKIRKFQQQKKKKKNSQMKKKIKNKIFPFFQKLSLSYFKNLKIFKVSHPKNSLKKILEELFSLNFFFQGIWGKILEDSGRFWSLLVISVISIYHNVKKTNQNLHNSENIKNLLILNS